MGLSKKKGQQQTLPDEKSRLTSISTSSRTSIVRQIKSETICGFGIACMIPVMLSPHL